MVVHRNKRIKEVVHEAAKVWEGGHRNDQKRVIGVDAREAPNTLQASKQKAGCVGGPRGATRWGRLIGRSYERALLTWVTRFLPFYL